LVMNNKLSNEPHLSIQPIITYELYLGLFGGKSV
jgi:hypothetical protein